MSVLLIVRNNFTLRNKDILFIVRDIFSLLRNTNIISFSKIHEHFSKYQDRCFVLNKRSIAGIDDIKKSFRGQRVET